jgi:shikimate dehydrogenase
LLSVAVSEQRKAGVLGSPIAHSLSPTLHQAAYRALGLPWEYEAYDVSTEGLAGYIASLDATWVGLSLTMPLKVEALAHCDALEPLALALGAANTILIRPEGEGLHLTGANTDVHGVKAAFREAGVVGVTSAVILGGGATATSALAALVAMGCPAPTVVVRTQEDAEVLLGATAAIGATPKLVGFDEAPEALARADVVVSTVPTSAGERVGEALAGVAVRGTLLDVVYDPLVTPLALAWERAGGSAIGGLRMLLHQAAEQVRLMTGRPAPIKEMDAALVSHLSR